MAMVKQLTFVSCHAGNLDDTCRTLVDYLAARLSLPIRFANEISWSERYDQLDRGQVDLAWICGAPYVRRMARPHPTLTLVAAPVWQGARYGARPVYFTDMIVHRASRFHTFADLQGSHWVYNEPGSLSGYVAPLAYLHQAGHSTAFFGQVTASGAHLQSLALVLAGQADVTCIDSVVLAEHLRRQPALQAELRVIEQIGPLPSMPWVAATHLPEALRQEVRRLLLAYPLEAGKPTTAASGALLGFAAAADGDYDPIRQVLRLAGE